MSGSARIDDVPPQVGYIGDGNQREFPFTFYIFEEGDVAVYINGAQQLYGFSVTGAGNKAGGTVVFATPPARNDVVTLFRLMRIRRQSEFPESGEFRASTLNEEFDRLTASVQQVGFAAARSIHQPIEDGSANMTLPSRADRAGKTLVFDAAGNVAVAVGADGLGSSDSGGDGTPTGSGKLSLRKLGVPSTFELATSDARAAIQAVLDAARPGDIIVVDAPYLLHGELVIPVDDLTLQFSGHGKFIIGRYWDFTRPGMSIYSAGIKNTFGLINLGLTHGFRLLDAVIEWQRGMPIARQVMVSAVYPQPGDQVTVTVGNTSTNFTTVAPGAGAGPLEFEIAVDPLTGRFVNANTTANLATAIQAAFPELIIDGSGAERSLTHPTLAVSAAAVPRTLPHNQALPAMQVNADGRIEVLYPNMKVHGICAPGSKGWELRRCTFRATGVVNHDATAVYAIDGADATIMDCAFIDLANCGGTGSYHGGLRIKNYLGVRIKGCRFERIGYRDGSRVNSAAIFCRNVGNAEIDDNYCEDSGSELLQFSTEKSSKQNYYNLSAKNNIGRRLGLGFINVQNETGAINEFCRISIVNNHCYGFAYQRGDKTHPAISVNADSSVNDTPYLWDVDIVGNTVSGIDGEVEDFDPVRACFYNIATGREEDISNPVKINGLNGGWDCKGFTVRRAGRVNFSGNVVSKVTGLGISIIESDTVNVTGCNFADCAFGRTTTGEPNSGSGMTILVRRSANINITDTTVINGARGVANTNNHGAAIAVEMEQVFGGVVDISCVDDGVAAAYGTITFATINPGDTITLGGVTWTLVATAPVGNQTRIQANLGATLTALAADLNASTDPQLAKCMYAYTGTANLAVTWRGCSKEGNTFSLAASNGTPSGPTLAGGGDSHRYALLLDSGPTSLPARTWYNGALRDKRLRVRGLQARGFTGRGLGGDVAPYRFDYTNDPLYRLVIEDTAKVLLNPTSSVQIDPWDRIVGTAGAAGLTLTLPPASFCAPECTGIPVVNRSGGSMTFVPGPIIIRGASATQGQYRGLLLKKLAANNWAGVANTRDVTAPTDMLWANDVIVRCASSTPVSMSIPLDGADTMPIGSTFSMALGTTIALIQAGAGVVTATIDPAGTINGATATTGVGSVLLLRKAGTDTIAHRDVWTGSVVTRDATASTDNPLLTDAGATVRYAGACAVTVPSEQTTPFAIGDAIFLLQAGTGTVTASPSAVGDTINGSPGPVSVASGSWAVFEPGANGTDWSVRRPGGMLVGTTYGDIAAFGGAHETDSTAAFIAALSACDTLVLQPKARYLLSGPIATALPPNKSIVSGAPGLQNVSWLVPRATFSGGTSLIKLQNGKSGYQFSGLGFDVSGHGGADGITLIEGAGVTDVQLRTIWSRSDRLGGEGKLLYLYKGSTICRNVSITDVRAEGIAGPASGGVPALIRLQGVEALTISDLRAEYIGVLADGSYRNVNVLHLLNINGGVIERCWGTGLGRRMIFLASDGDGITKTQNITMNQIVAEDCGFSAISVRIDNTALYSVEDLIITDVNCRGFELSTSDAQNPAVDIATNHATLRLARVRVARAMVDYLARSEGGWNPTLFGPSTPASTYRTASNGSCKSMAGIQFYGVDDATIVDSHAMYCPGPGIAVSDSRRIAVHRSSTASCGWARIASNAPPSNSTSAGISVTRSDGVSLFDCTARDSAPGVTKGPDRGALSLFQSNVAVCSLTATDQGVAAGGGPHQSAICVTASTDGLAVAGNLPAGQAAGSPLVSSLGNIQVQGYTGSATGSPALDFAPGSRLTTLDLTNFRTSATVTVTAATTVNPTHGRVVVTAGGITVTLADAAMWAGGMLETVVIAPAAVTLARPAGQTINGAAANVTLAARSRTTIRRASAGNWDTV